MLTTISGQRLSKFCFGTVQYYEKGERKGKPVEIPKAVSLACFAISCGIEDVDFSQPKGQPVLKDKGFFKINPIDTNS